MSAVRHFRPETYDEWAMEESVFDFAHLKQFQPEQESIIIDGGAHIGVTTLQMNDHFHHTNSPVKIHAFEPQPENYEFLVKNVCDYTNICPHVVGLGSAEERARLYAHGNSNGRHSIVPDLKYSGVYCEIDVIDTNEFILSLEHEVFICKLDLEGYEAEIINNNLTDLRWLTIY